MAYRYALKNVYRPTALAPKAYGWSSSRAYTRADVPTALTAVPATITAEQFLQQFAYEWYQSGAIGTGESNPPFFSGAAGRLPPSLQNAAGGPTRILRGYIRRAQFEVDPISRARLYFMYNPEIISRDYVSYLEQSALDPFNTVYQSGNLVAPPAILDFSFELFFDRQEEATQIDHPGVYVDYQFFDLVVRNVIPQDPGQTSNTLPDNGVMMVNPRDITVVFSPQMSVQGKPVNARVVFERFTHRMVPTRMRIALTMRAVYMGPVRDMTEYRAEQFAAEQSVPLDKIRGPQYITSMTEVFDNTEKDLRLIDAKRKEVYATINTVYKNYHNQTGYAASTNLGLNTDALNWARSHVTSSTRYSGADTGAHRYDLPTSADCSGLIVAAFRGVNDAAATDIFGPGYPGTESMKQRWDSTNYKYVNKILPANFGATVGGLHPGDLLWRKGHIAFFEAFEGSFFRIFDASSPSSNPQVGSRKVSNLNRFTLGISPKALGANSSANASSNSNSSSVQYTV